MKANSHEQNARSEREGSVGDTQNTPSRFFTEDVYDTEMKKRTSSKPGQSTRASGNLGPRKASAKRHSGGKKGAEKKGAGAKAAGGGIKLRVIGGQMRGRPIAYHGANFTRPMKDQIRENLFNILGKSLRGSIAMDLFAGTGALAIESLSRGCVSAKAVERDRMAAEYIRKNGVDLAIEDQLQVICGDTFRLGPLLLAPPPDDTPWTVYLCPPYEMWDSKKSQLLELIRAGIANAPPGSRIVIETEKWFDCDSLPGQEWDLRRYGTTVLGFYQPAMVCGLV